MTAATRKAEKSQVDAIYLQKQNVLFVLLPRFALLKAVQVRNTRRSKLKLKDGHAVNYIDPLGSKHVQNMRNFGVCSLFPSVPRRDMT